MTVSTVGTTFFVTARLDLALVTRFFGFALALVRFAAFPRTDLAGLRALPRIAAFPLRTAARFFRLAMTAACSGGVPAISATISVSAAPRRKQAWTSDVFRMLFFAVVWKIGILFYIPLRPCGHCTWAWKRLTIALYPRHRLGSDGHFYFGRKSQRVLQDRCVYRKPKPARNGDEDHQGSSVNWWFRFAERGERPAHLFPNLFSRIAGHDLVRTWQKTM
jgi:hypothetical protein